MIHQLSIIWNDSVDNTKQWYWTFKVKKIVDNYLVYMPEMMKLLPVNCMQPFEVYIVTPTYFIYTYKNDIQWYIKIDRSKFNSCISIQLLYRSCLLDQLNVKNKIFDYRCPNV